MHVYKTKLTYTIISTLNYGDEEQGICDLNFYTHDLINILFLTVRSNKAEINESPQDSVFIISKKGF